MSAGMPRTIPAPLRAKGTSPLGTPDCRRRTVNDGAITRLQLAIDPPCHGPPALVPTPFDGSQGSPSLRLRSPAPLHSSRMDFRYTGHARYVFRAMEYLARPNRDVRTAPKSLPQGPCNGLAARCTGPEIWSQRSSLPPSMLSRASSQAARMARSIPLAVNLMIRPVERLTA